MLYVPTRASVSNDLPLSPATAARRTMRELRVESERRAWASRPLLATPLRAAALPSVETPEADDPLVGLLAQLRAVTTRYVCGLRADGARPEQMLVEVKTFVREAMSAEGWHDPEAARALTEQVVRWSIGAYYDR